MRELKGFLFFNFEFVVQSRGPVRVSCSKGVEIGSKRKGRGGVSDSNFLTQKLTWETSQCCLNWKGRLKQVSLFRVVELDIGGIITSVYTCHTQIKKMGLCYEQIELHT